MTDKVDPAVIEDKVGAQRDPVKHLGRAVSAEQTFYILHSQECVDSGIDLRECPYSVGLDTYSVAPATWPQDVTLVIALDDIGALVPLPTRESLDG